MIEELSKRKPDPFVNQITLPEIKGRSMSLATMIVGFLPKPVILGLLEKGFSSIEPMVVSKTVEELKKVGVELAPETIANVLTAVGAAVETELASIL